MPIVYFCFCVEMSCLVKKLKFYYSNDVVKM